MRFGLLLFVYALSAHAELCPDERYSILSGRSFYQMSCDNRPHLNLVARLSSEDYPRPPDISSGIDLSFVYAPLRRLDSSQITLTAVQNVLQREGVTDDPVPATFMLRYLTSSNRDQVIRDEGKSLTMDQKVAAAQYLGFLASERYDSSKRLSLSRTIHTPNQVADAAMAEMAGTDPSMTAGDCADVANAQGVLLEKLGARDVMEVTGSTLTGLHTTVIARDPQNQTYHQLNYDIANKTSHREGADLIQVPGDASWADVGPSFYLNKPSGRTVAYVPTNAGKLYAEVAGLDIHEIEPLARTSSSLAGVQMLTPSHGSIQGFAARDSIGGYYAGVGLTQHWNTQGHFPGVIGTVVAMRETAQSVQTTDFYVQIEQRAVTPEFRFGRWFGLRFDGTIILLGSYSLSWSDMAYNAWGFGAALFLDAGAQLVVGGARGSARLRADLQLLPGVDNIAGSTPTVFVNFGSIILDGRLRLAHSLALTGGAGIVLDYFGQRLAFAGGFEYGPFALQLQAMGRVDDSSPTYKDGSLRRARLLGSYAPNRFFQFSLSGEVHEEPGWSVHGGLGSRF